MGRHGDILRRLRADKEVIIGRYEAGESTCELGRCYGCSNASIWLFLKNECGVELRQHATVEPNRKKIMEYFHQGKSAYWINRHLGLGANAAERAIASEGYDISHRKKQRSDPLVNHKEEIVRRYLAGEGTCVIGKDYGCNENSINELLRKCGVEIRPIRHYAKPVDESFFDVIDTEAKAYILGFWMADGCNSSHVPVARMSITDLDILHRMAEEMGFGGKIISRKRGTYKPIYLMAIGSRRMCDALTRLGCVRGKTYTAKFQTEDQVPRHLQRHLIRGWMDGDGSIYMNSRGKSWNMSIVGTEDVCRGIGDCIESHLGIVANVRPAFIGEKHTTWHVYYCSQIKVASILDWLYHDSTIHLECKHQKYLEFRLARPSLFQAA